MKTTKRPTLYDRGQHELICKAVGCSPLASEPGCTAYEAVCVLLTKLEVAEGILKQAATKKGIERKQLKETLKYLKAHHDSQQFCFLKMYGNP